MTVALIRGRVLYCTRHGANMVRTQDHYRLKGLSSLNQETPKATVPVALLQIFKNALSALLLIDIMRCIASFFSNETDLAIKYLEN